MDSSTTYSLGWTLVHFVWQGGVVAALLAGTNALLGRDAAQGRYWAACAALLLLLLAPVVTYGYLDVLRPAYEASTALAGQAVGNVAETAGPGRGVIVTPVPLPGETNGLNGFFAADQLLPWLVWGWLAGALVLGGRMLSGWLRLQWIRKAADPVSGLWCQRCDVLRRSLYIRRPVRLLESAKVAVPLTVGWIRPVVLVPVGFLSGLPVAQVEAILLHELAHIRRYDYLINLVLFYHPAVWWVSCCLRREREFCYDALVARRSRDGAEYGRSLLALEEWVQGTGRALAPAATQYRRFLGGPKERVRTETGRHTA